MRSASKNENNSVMALDHLDLRREGYSGIEAVAHLLPDSVYWVPFMRLARMLLWMLPAVQNAVRKRYWSRAVDPLDTLRQTAIRIVSQMKLKEPAGTKAAVDKFGCA